MCITYNRKQILNSAGKFKKKKRKAYLKIENGTMTH